MRLMHMLVGNYGWTIIIFTVVVRIVSIPLSLVQQKSMARTQAYQPMIQEIQKKWANDKQRQQQEMQKFYEENNIKMSAGCAPTIVNMLVLFGIIAVIQAPLNHILQLPAQQIENSVSVVEYYYPDLDINKDTYTQQSRLIGLIKSEPDRFITGVDITTDGVSKHIAVEAAEVQKIVDFDFQFLSLDLSAAPTLNFNRNIILPILSILTMFASQIIITLTSGQQNGKNMLVMSIVMGVMFGTFAFRVPLGFSLYYTVSNVASTLQQLILRKIHDPKKISEEIEKQLEEKKQQTKSKNVGAVKQVNGNLSPQTITDAEMAKKRLERARKLDAERYH